MTFSLIICGKNAAKRLSKTFDSILAQKFDDNEVVIVDGASSDGTKEVIQEYETKFSGRLKWISEKDSGLYNALNKGVRMASCEFLPEDKDSESSYFNISSHKPCILRLFNLLNFFRIHPKN